MKLGTPVKITGIDVCPLTGGTVDGGWTQGHEPQEDLHTIVVTVGDKNLPTVHVDVIGVVEGPRLGTRCSEHQHRFVPRDCR